MGPVEQFTNVTEAALAVGHRTYSGTVSSTDRIGATQLASHASVAEAAPGVGHRTHSGTVAATNRRR